MMFAAVVGHGSGRATPSLRHAPQRQSMEIVRRETIYRNRNAVQTKPATSNGYLLFFLLILHFSHPSERGANPGMQINDGALVDVILSQHPETA